MKVKDTLYAILLALNVFLLLSGMHSSVITLTLIFSSLLLVLHNPLALVPLMYVTAITSKFVVLPNIAGYFYYIILFVIGSVIKYQQFSVKGVSSWGIFTLLYIVWLIISSSNSISGSFELVSRMMVAIIPIFFISIFEYKDNGSLPIYMLVSAITLSTYVLLKLHIAPEWYIASADSDISLMNLLNAQITISEDLNPNTLAQSLLIAYIITYTIAINWKKWWLLLFTILPITSMIIIGSRTVFITMLIISIFALLFSIKRSILWKVIAIAAVVICLTSILKHAESINERLDIETIVEDDGSGRFDTWHSLIKNVVPLYPVAGVGYGRVNLSKLGYSVDADNMYIDALSQIGIVGLMLLLVMIFCYFKMLWRMQDITSRIAVSLLFAILVVGFGETVFDTYIFTFVLFCAVLAKKTTQNIEIDPSND